MKNCPDCGNDFPATNEYFCKNSSTKSGLATYCKICHNRRNSNRDSADYGYRRRYGVTKAQKIAMLAKQHGCCPVCGEFIFIGDKTTHIDHDHATGKFRGVLCSSCNQGLGNFKDDIDRLRAAIEYLEGQ